MKIVHCSDRTDGLFILELNPKFFFQGNQFEECPDDRMPSIRCTAVGATVILCDVAKEEEVLP